MRSMTTRTACWIAAFAACSSGLWACNGGLQSSGNAPTQEACENVAAWSPNTAYTIGDLAEYAGLVYRCMQAQAGGPSETPAAAKTMWSPTGAPACTLGVGGDAGGGAGGGAGSSDSGTGSDGGRPSPPPPPPPPPPPGTGSGVFFSAYKDTSINMNWNTNVISTNVPGAATPLASDLSRPAARRSPSPSRRASAGARTGPASPATRMATANVSLLAQAGVKYIISTGGAAGSFTCGSDAGMSTFIGRWASPGLVGVDFDIEAGQSAERDRRSRRRASRRRTAVHTRACASASRWRRSPTTTARATAQSLGASAQDSFNAYGDKVVGGREEHPRLLRLGRRRGRATSRSTS